MEPEVRASLVSVFTRLVSGTQTSKTSMIHASIPSHLLQVSGCSEMVQPWASSSSSLSPRIRSKATEEQPRSIRRPMHEPSASAGA